MRFRKRRQPEKIIERVNPRGHVRILRTAEELEEAERRAADHDEVLLEKIERRLKRTSEPA